ncbi:MAG TPA: vitamin K epoxide reductase family protein [Acidobacteriota bacterium]|jgi:uncharacterized membrane protein|nr:vitamin K epoxide reductase family protein [Acidobacteriota bacterium]
MIPRFIFALALIGLSISTYFTAIAYGWMDPEARYIPKFCQMGKETCASIVFTPRARVFGVPNSLLGQLYYLLLLAGILSGWLWQFPLVQVMLAASLLTVLLGVYLTYSLLFWTKVSCKLCFTSHALNAVIFVLLVWNLIIDGPEF